MRDRTQERLDEAKKLGINTGKPAALAAFATGRVEDAIAASTPGGIEASEARGQQELVRKQQLPKKGLLEHRQRLELIGFVFGKEIDDVFIQVKLPDGWKKQATDHSMWSDLLDSKCRHRASIFYKAAFYDRSGYMKWERRFSLEARLDGSNRSIYDLEDAGGKAHCYAVVLDAGAEIYRTASSSEPLSGNIHDTANEKLWVPLTKEAEKWLTDKYPNWKDSFATWDD